VDQREIEKDANCQLFDVNMKESQFGRNMTLQLTFHNLKMFCEFTF
jgi:hypothetical protein